MPWNNPKILYTIENAKKIIKDLSKINGYCQIELVGERLHGYYTFEIVVPDKDNVLVNNIIKKLRNLGALIRHTWKRKNDKWSYKLFFINPVNEAGRVGDLRVDPSYWSSNKNQANAKALKKKYQHIKGLNIDIGQGVDGIALWYIGNNPFEELSQELASLDWYKLRENKPNLPLWRFVFDLGVPQGRDIIKKLLSHKETYLLTGRMNRISNKIINSNYTPSLTKYFNMDFDNWRKRYYFIDWLTDRLFSENIDVIYYPRNDPVYSIFSPSVGEDFTALENWLEKNNIPYDRMQNQFYLPVKIIWDKVKFDFLGSREYIAIALIDLVYHILKNFSEHTFNGIITEWSSNTGKYIIFRSKEVLEVVSSFLVDQGIKHIKELIPGLSRPYNFYIYIDYSELSWK